ncbi:MAG TPA: UTRA domain-containing protein [Aliidongia sp.]|nr:UTRA domain-containing protein [Aliidongia sp.]
MKDEELELDGIGPLWQQIQRAIARPILNGAWQAGTRVPSELDLMTRFGAARMTVHRALRNLAGEGLVARRRRAGTVVAVVPPERPVFEIWDIAAEIEASGSAYGFDLIERHEVPADDPRRALLAVGPTDGLLALTVRHRADDRPVQLEERLINLTAAPQALDETFEPMPPGRWLLRTIDWTEAEHAISAGGAPAGIARPLDIEPDTACLIVERRTWNGAMPVTFARLWHPGDTRRLIGRFTRTRN